MRSKCKFKSFPRGLCIAQTDAGWCASYTNSVGSVHEIGVFADKEQATAAGTYWCKGFRFDAVRAEYEAFATAGDLGHKYQCHTDVIFAVLAIAGATIRTPSEVARQRRKNQLRAEQRPMSEQAKQNIRDGMERARLAKGGSIVAAPPVIREYIAVNGVKIRRKRERRPLTGPQLDAARARMLANRRNRIDDTGINVSTGRAKL